MQIKGIDHVQVAAPAGCEADARHFYGTLLGLSELPKPEPLASRGGVWFQVGPQELHIGVEKEFQPARKAHPCFVVDDLDAFANRLTTANIPVKWDHDRPEIRRFYIEDPWGNRIELMQG